MIIKCKVYTVKKDLKLKELANALFFWGMFGCLAGCKLKE